MRRLPVLFAFMSVAAPAATSAALALTKDYPGGDCRGTRDDDTLTGSPRRYVIFGLDGEDTLYGFRNGDLLKGRPDADLLRGGEGDDGFKG
jgi:hypothetical protein